MKRLFTFGCSFTNYNWPTWADLLGQEYLPLYYNWGYPGLGNRAIAERVAECHARMDIGPEDTVVVQWSSPLRNDYMKFDLRTTTEGTKWKTHGSIFSKENSRIYDRKWIADFWDEKAYLVHTLNNIILTIGILESTGCSWRMTAMNDITLVGNELSERTFGGEYQPKGLKHFWELDHSLDFYRELIWEKHKDKWVDDVINVVFDTPELCWAFDFDKTRDIEKTYPVKDGKWEEAHPTIRQHAIWMLGLKESLGLKPELTQEQLNLIKEVEGLKDSTSTFQQFEKGIMDTEWFISRQYRGL